MQLPNHFCWIRGAKDNASLLKSSISAGGAERPFPIGCKTDGCIVVWRSRMDAEAFITCTVEVKRHVVKQSMRQAQTQFVCASLKSSLLVISTLTDMIRVWHTTLLVSKHQTAGQSLLLCNSRSHDAISWASYAEHSARYFASR